MNIKNLPLRTKYRYYLLKYTDQFKNTLRVDLIMKGFFDSEEFVKKGVLNKLKFSFATFFSLAFFYEFSSLLKREKTIVGLVNHYLTKKE